MKKPYFERLRYRAILKNNSEATLLWPKICFETLTSHVLVAFMTAYRQLERYYDGKQECVSRLMKNVIREEYVMLNKSIFGLEMGLCTTSHE